MKKLFILLFTVLLTNSCIEETPIETYEQYFTIRQWIWHPDQFYFYCDVDIPELTKYVFDHGVINTYYAASIDGDEVLYPLPYDYYERDASGMYTWTEQSTCEIYPGVIRFITQYNDFRNPPVPPALTFRVKMMW